MKTKSTSIVAGLLLAGLLLACKNEKAPQSQPTSEKEAAFSELDKAPATQQLDKGPNAPSLIFEDNLMFMTARHSEPMDISTICEKKQVNCASLLIKNRKNPSNLPDGIYAVQYKAVADTLIEMQALDAQGKKVSTLGLVFFDKELSKIPTPIPTPTTMPQMPCDYNLIPDCMRRLTPQFAYFQNLANTTCTTIRYCFICPCKGGRPGYILMRFTPTSRACQMVHPAVIIMDRTLSSGGDGEMPPKP